MRRGSVCHFPLWYFEHNTSPATTILLPQVDVHSKQWWGIPNKRFINFKIKSKCYKLLWRMLWVYIIRRRCVKHLVTHWCGSNKLYCRYVHKSLTGRIIVYVAIIITHHPDHILYLLWLINLELPGKKPPIYLVFLM